MRRDANDRVKRAETVARMLEVAEQHSGRFWQHNKWDVPRLTCHQIRETLSFALSHGLLVYTDRDGAYKTTQKGSEFLRSYRSMCDMFSSS